MIQFHRKFYINIGLLEIIIATTVNSLVKLGIVFVLGGKKLGGIMALFYLLTIGALVGGLVVG